MKDIEINEAPTESYGASFTPAAAETIKQLLINAGKDMKKKALRSARVSFETILQLDSQNLHARLGLAEIYLRNRKYSKIVSTLLPSPDHSKSPSWSSNSKVLEYLGDAFYYQKKYKESLKAYDTSLHSILQENVIKSGGRIEATAKADRVNSILSLKVKLANVLYDAGEQEAAINIVQNIFKETEEFIPSLILYAKAANDRSQRAAAIQILLKGIVKDSENKVLRQNIADMVGADGGMKDLMETFVGETGNGLSSALAFLGTILKDHGKILASAILYEKAVEATPDSASYSLNLMHVYEIAGNYRKALSVAIRFLEWNMTKGTKGVRCVSDEDVLQVLRSLKVGGDAEARPTAYPIDTLNFDVDPDEFKLTWMAGKTPMQLWRNEDSHTLPLMSPATLKLAAPTKKLSNEELDHLAIYFTIVKILFCVGEVQMLPRLVYLIENCSETLLFAFNNNQK